MQARVTVCQWVFVFATASHAALFVCECIVYVYGCLITCVYVSVCVYASTSACLFVYFLYVLLSVRTCV